MNETLPQIAESRWLVKNGEIWLPNINTIGNSICLHRQKLELYFAIYQVPIYEVDRNPLYLATESVRDGLHRCSPPLDNANQLEYLTNYSSHPFYKLTIKDRFASGSLSVGGDRAVVASPDIHTPPPPPPEVSSWSPAAQSCGSTTWPPISAAIEERSGGGSMRGANVRLDPRAGRVVVDLTGDEWSEMVDCR